jgi:hypothetical protein
MLLFEIARLVRERSVSQPAASPSQKKRKHKVTSQTSLEPESDWFLQDPALYHYVVQRSRSRPSAKTPKDILTFTPEKEEKGHLPLEELNNTLHRSTLHKLINQFDALVAQCGLSVLRYAL